VIRHDVAVYPTALQQNRSNPGLEPLACTRPTCGLAVLWDRGEQPLFRG